MSKENTKYPHLIVTPYIFNDKNELFLVKSPKWNNKFIVPGGHVEIGETLEDALRREMKEETDMNIVDIEFMSTTEATDLTGKTDRFSHMVFINYYAKFQGDLNNIKLNNEATKYKWQSVEKWLKDKNKIGMASLEVLEEKHWEKIGLEQKYQRALADYQNLVKRSQLEKADFAKYANEQLILDILPIYDNLKVSMEHVDESAKTNGWAEGIKYVIKQFTDTLKNFGVEEIKAKGKKFDPNIMEALEGEGEKVKKVVKPGYTLKGKVLVPARVVLE